MKGSAGRERRLPKFSPTFVHCPPSNEIYSRLVGVDKEPASDLVDGRHGSASARRSFGSIDRELKNDPEYKVSEWEDVYLYRSDPLVVVVRISPGDRLVEVIDVQLLD